MHKMYKLFVRVVLNAPDAIPSASVIIVSRDLRFVSLAELYNMAPQSSIDLVMDLKIRIAINWSPPQL